MNANLETPVKINQFLKDTLKNGKKYLSSNQEKLFKIIIADGFIFDFSVGSNFSFIPLEDTKKSAVLTSPKKKEIRSIELICEACGTVGDFDAHDNCGSKICSGCADDHEIECTTKKSSRTNSPAKKKKGECKRQVGKN